MTVTVDKNSPDYEKYVHVGNGELPSRDTDEYQVIISDVPPDTQVQCPSDHDMHIMRRKNGDVIVTKKCFCKNPFSV